MSDIVSIYSDGACKGNPGPGGWGALLVAGGREREMLRRRGAHHQQPHGTAGRHPGAGGADAALRDRPLHRLAVREERHRDLDPRLEAQRVEDRGQEAREERRPVARAGRAGETAHRSAGTGCADTTTIRATSAPTRWPIAASTRSAAPRRPPAEAAMARRAASSPSAAGAAPAALTNADVVALRAAAGRFGGDAAAGKTSLLARCAACALTDAAALVEYHDALLFLLAYPETPALRAAAQRELGRGRRGRAGARRRGTARARRALAGSGLPGSATSATFSLDIARWLVDAAPGARAPRRLRRRRRVGGRPPTVALPALEAETVAAGADDATALVASLAGERARPLDWLVATVDRIDGDATPCGRTCSTRCGLRRADRRRRRAVAHLRPRPRPPRLPPLRARAGRRHGDGDGVAAAPAAQALVRASAAAWWTSPERRWRCSRARPTR